MNLVEDVATYLEQQGTGAIGTNLFCAYLPDKPDSAIVLYEYAGLPINRLDRAFCGLSLQVCVRSPDYPEGLLRAQGVSDALVKIGDTDMGFSPVAINGTTYFQFSALQSPYKLREDDDGRAYFVQNFRVWARAIN